MYLSQNLKCVIYQTVFISIILIAVVFDIYFQLSKQVFDEHVKLVLGWFCIINFSAIIIVNIIRLMNMLKLNYLFVALILSVNIIFFKLVFYYVFNFSKYFPSDFFELIDITSNATSVIAVTTFVSLLIARFITTPSWRSAVFCLSVAVSLVLPNLTLFQSSSTALLKNSNTDYLKNAYGIIDKNIDENPYDLPVISKKFNLYIIVFDSFLPPPLIRKYFSYDAASADISAKELPFTKSFVVYNDHFSEFDTSSFSFDSMLRFGLENYAINYSWGSIRGENRSGFYDVFSKSGFQLHHSYNHDLMKRAHEKNNDIYQKKFYPFIHKYWFYDDEAMLSQSLLCINSEHGNLFKRHKGLGLCSIFGNYTSIHQVISSFKGQGSKSTRTRTEQAYSILEKLTADIETPKIVSLSIQGPIGHTHEGYDHSNESEKAKYRIHYRQQEKRVALYMRKYINLIHSRDPDSIILIFGDHGPNFLGDWESFPLRNHANLLEISKLAEVMPENVLRLFVETRLNTYFGIAHNGNKCASEENISHFKGKYFSAPRILYSIAKCMSDKPRKEYSTDFFPRNPMTLRYLMLHK